MMINLTRPFYIAPVHGEPRHQFMYNQIAKGMGYPDHRIFTLEAGIPLEMDDKNAKFGEEIPTGRVLVDNSGTPGVSDEVLRDRYNVANDGAVDTTHGEVVGDPTILSKGFHGPKGLLEDAQDLMVDALASLNPSEIKDLNRVKLDSTAIVRKFMAKRGKLRPLIVASVIEV